MYTCDSLYLFATYAYGDQKGAYDTLELAFQMTVGFTTWEFICVLCKIGSLDC